METLLKTVGLLRWCNGTQLTSVEECNRSDGVSWFPELARIMAVIASQRVMDVSAGTRSCKYKLIESMHH